MTKNGLPAHWTVKRIGEIRQDKSKGINPSKFADETFELYSVPSFEARRPERVRGAEIGSSKKTVTPDTVLFCKINPRINRVWRVHETNGQPQIASTEWIQFAPINHIYPDYLRLFLTTTAVRDYAASNVSGVGGSLMRIRATVLDELEIPVPPLDEQKQIVDEIETQLARLDDAVASLQRARSRLKRYRASMLKAACEGRLVPTEAELARQEGRDYEPASVLLDRIKAERDTSARGKRRKGKEIKTFDSSTLPELPEGWGWTSWEDLASRVTVGHVGPIKNEYVPSGIPFLRSQNVRENRFDPSGLLFITPDFHLRLSKSKVLPGDLAVVRSGMVGVTCVIPVTLVEANCADLVLIQRPKGIVPQYGAYYMNSLAKRLIRQGQVGVALIHFNTRSVAALPVPLPPLAEQNRIVAEVERRLSILDKLESTVETNLGRADALRQSILRAAFGGQNLRSSAA